MATSPIHQLKEWLKDAEEQVSGNWNAMCVSTVGQSNSSDSRMVLFKQFVEEDLAFFTNYQSKKGEDIFANNKVSVVFFWDVIGRQIRIQGVAKKTSRSISEAYFNSRPFGSRVSAILSEQSREIKSYNDLFQHFEELKSEYSDKKPVCPDHWGGIQIEIQKIEFWQEHESRLHERTVFYKNGQSWSKKLLSP